MDALPETKKLAPGPIPFPMFGNIPHFGIGVFQGKTVVQLMSEWKKRYGPAMTVWLGPVPAIFVTDYDLAMDLFVKQGDAFVDRLKPPVFAVARKGLGIVMAEGDLWVEQRRFALHTLRNFGLGRNLMQVRILAEFHKQMAPIERQLEANGGTAKVDPRRMFNLLIGSIINSLLVGITYDEDNCEEFMTLRKKIESMANKIGLVNFFLEKIPVIGRGFDDIVNVQLDVFDHLKGLLHKRKQQIESGEYSLENGPQDYMDAYLLEIKNRTEANMGYFSEEQLYTSMLDMWAAGQETMITTLMWTMIFMINYPGKQEKLREELLKVVGKDRDVEESDRKDLPYLLAAINEIQRISSIINFNFFRRSTRETMCGKYTLPKGTAAGVIMSVIFQDDKNFPDSLKFEPERFLDGENGKHQQQMMIPFGVGKRMCMGEGLARAELYLIIGNLFKSYKVSMAEGEAPEEPVKRLSIFRRPKSFECLFQKVN